MLLATNISVSVLNPKQIKHFAHVMLTVNKTDKVDAQLIALYGSKLEPTPYKMPAKST